MHGCWQWGVSGSTLKVPDPGGKGLNDLVLLIESESDVFKGRSKSGGNPGVEQDGGWGFFLFRLGHNNFVVICRASWWGGGCIVLKVGRACGRSWLGLAFGSPWWEV